MKKITFSLLLLLLLAAMPAAAFGTAASEGAPTAENLEISTYRGVSVGGKLSAFDSDGSIVSYEITTPPGKGSVEVGPDGSFVYTPEEGKKGKDYFGYKAVDDQGNYSSEATVIIRIQKQKTRTTYSDLEGHPSAWAAVMLAEKGIFTGSCIAGEYVFSADEPVSRSQFLAMCMKAADTDILWDVGSTGFADDKAIAAWARPYVGTALSMGFVNGYADDGKGAVFSPDEPISALEAAVILDRVMELTDAVAVWYGYDESIPAWAVQSAANLSALGISPAGLSLSDESLTRAQAAEMICRCLLSQEK